MSLDPSLEGLISLLAGYLSCQIDTLEQNDLLRNGCVIRATRTIREPLNQDTLAWLRCHARYWVDKAALDRHGLAIDIGNIEQTMPDAGLSTIKLSYNLTTQTVMDLTPAGVLCSGDS